MFLGLCLRSDDGAGRLPGGGFHRHIWREWRAAGIRREGAGSDGLAAGGCKEQKGKKNNNFFQLIMVGLKQEMWWYINKGVGR